MAMITHSTHRKYAGTSVLLLNMGIFVVKTLVIKAFDYDLLGALKEVP